MEKLQTVAPDISSIFAGSFVKSYLNLCSLRFMVSSLGLIKHLQEKRDGTFSNVQRCLHTMGGGGGELSISNPNSNSSMRSSLFTFGGWGAGEGSVHQKPRDQVLHKKFTFKFFLWSRRWKMSASNPNSSVFHENLPFSFWTIFHMMYKNIFIDIHVCLYLLHVKYTSLKERCFLNETWR